MNISACAILSIESPGFARSAFQSVVSRVVHHSAKNNWLLCRRFQCSSIKIIGSDGCYASHGVDERIEAHIVCRTSMARSASRHSSTRFRGRSDSTFARTSVRSVSRASTFYRPIRHSSWIGYSGATLGCTRSRSLDSTRGTSYRPGDMLCTNNCLLRRLWCRRQGAKPPFAH